MTTRTWPTSDEVSSDVHRHLRDGNIDMAHTPAELLRVNIFIDERAFTTA